jgi:ribose-phosphate pyrophosphokinase
MTKELLLFAGTSHPELSGQIAQQLGLSLGRAKIEQFPDCEIGVQINENVRGRDVFVLQSIARRPNFYLMEMLIIIDALKRASVRSITAVIPYFGYARQDRKDKGRVPITAKLVANLLEKAGVNRILTMDLHAEQVEGFFDIPVDHLRAYPLLADAAKELGISKPVVVAPDIGSVRLCRRFAQLFGADIAVVEKHRKNGNEVTADGLIGKVENRDLFVIDDICSTGMTLMNAFSVCQRAGAKRMVALVIHGLSLEGVLNSGAERIVTTDTVPQKGGKGIHVVSVAPLFAQAIKRVAMGQSLSELFK